MRTPLPKTIVPHEGLGPLRFGASRGDVRQLLGSPSDEPDLSIDGWETWTYSYHAIEVTFSDDAEWRCTCLWTDSLSVLLAGRAVLGLELAELTSFVSTLGLGTCVGKIDPHLGPSLDFPESDLEIAFDDGVSCHVTWQARIDDGDQYVFPQPTIAA